jgi:hypothetical protein
MVFAKVLLPISSDDIAVIRAPGGDAIARDYDCAALLHRHIASRR